MKFYFIRPQVLACFLYLCSLFFTWAHAQSKKILTPQDYKLWDSSASIGRGKVSNDGNWMSYILVGKTGRDTVFLRNAISGDLYNFSASKVLSKF